MCNRAIELQRLPGVEKVLHSLEVSSYSSGPVLEGYFEAYFGDGGGVAWLIDVRWNQDSWTIEATLNRFNSEPQETLLELPVENPKEFGDFVSAFRRMVPELLALNIPESESDPWSGWPGREIQ
jgi:hypothetical protein